MTAALTQGNHIILAATWKDALYAAVKLSRADAWTTKMQGRIAGPYHFGGVTDMIISVNFPTPRCEPGVSRCW